MQQILTKFGSPYEIKLLCDNCGKHDYYQLPFKAEWHDYDNHFWGNSGFVTEDGISFTAVCKNCGLPKLKAVYWNYRQADDERKRSHGSIRSSETSP
jgi:hypothetical protein